MKKTILIVLAVLSFFSTDAQTWQWATHLGKGPSGENILSSCLDNSDNLYVTGRYYMNIIIGDDTLNSQVNAGFLAKIDENGSVVWAKKMEGDEIYNGYGASGSIFHDSYDNSLFVYSSMSGPNQSIGECLLFAGGETQEFAHHLTKLDLDGNCDWNILLDDVWFYSLVSDGQGSLYGIIKTSATGSVFDGEFINAGRFLVKLDSETGAVQWTKKILDWSHSIPTLAYFNGNLWVSGSTGSETEFNLDTVNSSAYEYDIFVSKFDTTGSLQWVNIIGGEGIEGTAHIGVDNQGEAYLTGYFTTELFFGDTSITAIDDRDIFIAKIDAQGERLWLKQSSANDEVIHKMSVTDNFGNTIVTGSFSGSVTFGQYTVVSPSGEAGFLAKYNSAGSCIGVKTLVNSSSPIPAVDSNGNIVAAGGFHDTSNFDGITLTSASVGDVFVAKIDLKTAIPEYRIDGNNELFIYANPNLGKCTIDVPDDFLYENNLVLRVFDTNGKLIRQTPLVMNQGRIQLNLEQEAKGIYTATLSNNEKSYHGRIVFE